MKWAVLFASLCLVGVSSGADDGTININSVTVLELQEHTGINKIAAGAIVAYGKATGGFRSTRDLQNVPGMTQRTLDALDGKVKFQENEVTSQASPEESEQDETVIERPSELSINTMSADAVYRRDTITALYDAAEPITVQTGTWQKTAEAWYSHGRALVDAWQSYGGAPRKDEFETDEQYSVRKSSFWEKVEADRARLEGGAAATTWVFAVKLDKLYDYDIEAGCFQYGGRAFDSAAAPINRTNAIPKFFQAEHPTEDSRVLRELEISDNGNVAMKLQPICLPIEEARAFRESFEAGAVEIELALNRKVFYNDRVATFDQQDQPIGGKWPRWSVSAKLLVGGEVVIED